MEDHNCTHKTRRFERVPMEISHLIASAVEQEQEWKRLQSDVDQTPRTWCK